MAKRAVTGIDHAVVVIDDIDQAAATYARLGFQVQPRGFHTRLGTANHLMIFDRNYFELIGIVEPNEFNAERREKLKLGQGLANIALSTDGADVAREAFAAAGLAPDPVLAFQRPVDIDGKQETAAFRTVRIPKSNHAVVGYFVCEHLTPQFVYRAAWAEHPNAVKRLTGATIVARDPSAWTDLVGRHFGAGAVKSSGGELVVDGGAANVRYVTPQRFAELHPGVRLLRSDDHPALLSFAVGDLGKTETALKAGGVPYVTAGDGRLLVAGADACGVALEFSKA